MTSDLTAAVERLREESCYPTGNKDSQVRDAIRTVLDALESAQQDARRYRWLRERAQREGRNGGWMGVYTFPIVQAWDDTPYAATRNEGFHHQTLDAAIDAAMGEGK